MHYCMNDCSKYIGTRGFCSKKCHDEFYDDKDRFEIYEN
jgi:hypothetical protein